MKTIRHKVQIKLGNHSGDREEIISGTMMRLPQKLLQMIFGDFTDVLLITPGRTVDSIEIKEVGKGGAGSNE